MMALHWSVVNNDELMMLLVLLMGMLSTEALELRQFWSSSIEVDEDEEEGMGAASSFSDLTRTGLWASDDDDGDDAEDGDDDAVVVEDDEDDS
jgi:hypothetical protein